jgi:hypothetical protein
LEAAAPPSGINGLGFAAKENADAEGGMGIKEAGGEKLILTVEEEDQFAGFSRAILMAHTVGEHPGMAGADAGLGGRADTKPQGGDGGNRSAGAELKICH